MSQIAEKKFPRTMLLGGLSVNLNHLKTQNRLKTIEFFLNNTNLIFLAVLYKIDIEGFQNQQK